MANGNNSTTSSRRVINRLVGTFVHGHQLRPRTERTLTSISTRLNTALNRRLRNTLPTVTLSKRITLSATCRGSYRPLLYFTRRIGNCKGRKSMFLNVSASNGDQGMVCTTMATGTGNLGMVKLAKTERDGLSSLTSIYVHIPRARACGVRRLRLPICRTLYLVLRRRFFRVWASGEGEW